jgi:quercetin dioxygenase-like cupin family protein
MKKTSLMSIPALVLCLAGCANPPVGEMNFADGVVQHAVLEKDIDWKPCPPHLPPGCEVAVLEGDPRSSGLFTVRFRMDGDFVMPPHTHPKDERVTVLKGRVSVAFGNSASRADAKHFMPGDYYVNSRGAVHTVWGDDASVVQITGIGPWEANFVE